VALPTQRRARGRNNQLLGRGEHDVAGLEWDGVAGRIWVVDTQISDVEELAADVVHHRLGRTAFYPCQVTRQHRYTVAVVGCGLNLRNQHLDISKSRMLPCLDQRTGNVTLPPGQIEIAEHLGNAD
jgi:hypothetical protein